jgi:branched-chain amino acid transport system permease protein
VTARVVAAALVALALVVLPFVLSDARTGELATAGAYFVAILGLDVLGRSGRISLGHGAFMGIGAYATAILVQRHGTGDLAAIAAAGAATGGIGLLGGIPALRLSGRHIAIATFGAAVAFPTIPRKFDGFAGGSPGISFAGDVTGAGVRYALTWAVGGALFVCTWVLLSSRFGRSLRALRDSELAAATSGVSRSLSRLAAFGLSTTYGGVAGALYAIDAGRASADAFPVQLSLYLVVGAVAGFYGSLAGALLGALLVEFLPDLVGLVPHAHANQPAATTFAFGVILVAATLLLPLVLRIRSALR